MTSLWTAAEIARATGGRVAGDFVATGISIDSRSLLPGDLFVALVGENGDGHAHVADALARGAGGALVHQSAGGALFHQNAAGALVHQDAGGALGHQSASGALTHRNAAGTPVHQAAAGPVVIVDDTLTGLQALAGAGRARFGGKTIAVTGSVGKTTTKEMLRTILGAFGPAHAAAASHNNHWGVPLTLARLPKDAIACVVEIGMNHAGEIAPLARLARPDAGIITGIEPTHIGHLGSLAAIADEKASLFDGMTAGFAILPAGSPLFDRLRARARALTVVTFGAGGDAVARAVTADENGSEIDADILGTRIRYRLGAPGPHMVADSLAALAAIAALGFDPAAGAAALAGFAPMAGRGARRPIRLPGGRALLLDESYNASGASVRAALHVLKLQPARRRIAVLGDMLELGEAGPAEHAALVPDVAAGADLLFACGPLMRNLYDAVPAQNRAALAASSADLAPVVAAALADGDAVLVKGSLGSQMRLVVQALDRIAA